MPRAQPTFECWSDSPALVVCSGNAQPADIVPSMGTTVLAEYSKSEETNNAPCAAHPWVLERFACPGSLSREHSTDYLKSPLGDSKSDFGSINAPGAIRTLNRLIRSQALYPLSYGGVPKIIPH